MPGGRPCPRVARVPEGLSAAEVGKEIAAHRRREAERDAARRGRWISITEAVLLSVVAVFAAYSGFCAAKWGTEASVSLAKASAARTEANRADLEALEIRTLDSVSFTPAFEALVSKDPAALRLAVRRLRPGYRPAFRAWLAQHPLTNPGAAPGPSYLPQYRIPQTAESHRLDAKADAAFLEGRKAGETADNYVRLTVLLATVLFLVGISSHFPVHVARYGMIGMALALLAGSFAELASLPGPPG
jgi:hypothetical protein